MQNKNMFILSGIISFSFYILICFIFIYYVVDTKPKTYTAKPKTTVIQLDMIVEKSDKKRIEKKEDKKTETPLDKIVKKSTSKASKKSPDLKSLFGNVKTKEIKTPQKEVNNVIKSADPKRFKAKFEKQKKSSNVKIDSLLKDKITTTNISAKNLSKSKESDEYYSKVTELLYAWTPSTLRDSNLVATVIVTISKNGAFDYRFSKFSQNANFDMSLKAFLEEQKSIMYPKPKNGRSVKISVDFKSKG